MREEEFPNFDQPPASEEALNTSSVPLEHTQELKATNNVAHPISDAAEEAFPPFSAYSASTQQDSKPNADSWQQSYCHGAPPTWNQPASWYQMPPMQPGMSFGQPLPKQLATVPQKPRLPRDARKLRFVLILLSILVLCGLLYCIVSDIIYYRTADHTGNAELVHPRVVLEMQEKPELDPSDPLVDESGRYSVEGVAEVVRPSIVELYGYTDEIMVGSGSGIIISEDGYIVTNAHVLVENADYQVVTSDGTAYDAMVVGKDTKTDIAVIQIAANDLPVATIGNSDEVVVGESVVAIGNPAGLTGSVTNGIVSGLNRQIRADSTGFDMDCIQTNAAISPGNSGGALVNMYGQVIGITSSKYVSSSYEGLGFAITINQALPVIQELMEQGYISGRVRIGIEFMALQTEYVIQQFIYEVGVDDPEDITGIWITNISEDCDIADTELQVNDVIVEAEGIEVVDYDSLCAAIEGKVGGDTVTAVCRRYDETGRYREFTVTFALMEDTSGDY